MLTLFRVAVLLPAVIVGITALVVLTGAEWDRD